MINNISCLFISNQKVKPLNRIIITSRYGFIFLFLTSQRTLSSWLNWHLWHSIKDHLSVLILHEEWKHGKYLFFNLMPKVNPCFHLQCAAHKSQMSNIKKQLFRCSDTQYKIYAMKILIKYFRKHQWSCPLLLKLQAVGLQLS